MPGLQTTRRMSICIHDKRIEAFSDILICSTISYSSFGTPCVICFNELDSFSKARGGLGDAGRRGWTLSRRNISSLNSPNQINLALLILEWWSRSARPYSSSRHQLTGTPLWSLTFLVGNLRNWSRCLVCFEKTFILPLYLTSFGILTPHADLTYLLLCRSLADSSRQRRWS